MKLFIAAILALTPVLSQMALATDYYVSSTRANRSDSNPGTSQDAPWATFNKVKTYWSSLNPGDTVHLERGSTFPVSFSGDYWYMSKGGSASGGRITLTGADYGSGNKPIIHRTGGDSNEGKFLFIKKSYITVRDLEINGGNSDYGLHTTAVIINADQEPLSNVQVLNLKVHNLGGGRQPSAANLYICGIWVKSWDFNGPQTISDCLIEGNEVSDYSAHGLNHYSEGAMINITWRNNIVKNTYPASQRFGISPTSTLGACSALQITTGSSGCIFENNILEDQTSSEGNVFAFSKYNNDTGVNIIRNNIIQNCESYGVSFWRDHSGQKVLYDIYGNVICNNGRQGLLIFTSNSWGSGSAMNFYNNTLYNNCNDYQSFPGGEIELYTASQNLTLKIINNLIVHTSDQTASLSVNTGFSGTLIHNNNLYWHTGGASKNAIYNKGGYISQSNVLSFESSAQNANPLFVNASGGDFTLLSSSPAINTGADMGMGNDIGAAQYDGTITTPPPTDTTAPTVFLTAPSDGATVSGSATTVSATASDETGLAGVQFKLNGANLGAEDTTLPYSISWNTTGETNNSYNLTATARDTSGNTATSINIAVTVTNIPLPEDAIIGTASWQNQSFSAHTDSFTTEFNVVPDGSNMDGVTGLSSGDAAAYDDLAIIVRFNQEGQIDVRNGEEYTADTSFDYTADTDYHFRVPVDLITHTYSVYVQTDGGPETLIANNYAFRTSQNAITQIDNLATTSGIGSHMVYGLTVADTVQSTDQIAPAVSIVSPSSGTTVSGSSVPVTATASDNVSVAGVLFKLDGSNIGTEDTAQPYSISWNTTSASNGQHSLTAVARDASGNTATSTETTITVENPDVAGVDYYASSTHANRNDANPGTSPDMPWATFDKVKASWASLNAGDTVHLERGSTWDISFTGDFWYMSNGGSASGGQITLRGDDFGTGDKPIIHRTGGDANEGKFLMIQGSYITVRDFEFNGGNSDYGNNTTAIIINADGKDTSHVNVLNTKVHNLGGNTSLYICGIWTESWSANTISDCLIEGNEVYDYCAHGLNHYSHGKLQNITWRNNIVKNSYSGGRFGANSALQITSGSSGCLFEYNVLEDTTGSEGIIFAFSKYSDDDGVNTIRYNIVKNSPAYGISFWRDQAGYKLLYDIYGNIICNNSKQGFYVKPSSSFAAGSVLNFYNNTLYNNSSANQSPNEGEIELREATGNLTVRLINNLIVHPSTQTSSLGIDSSFAGNLVHNNNLYWHPDGTSHTAVYNKGAYYTVANVKNYESSAQNTDPKLTSTTPPSKISSTDGTDANGLSISTDSPAFGTGVNLGSTYAKDINFAVRSGTWSIGAYEPAGTEPQPADIPTPPSRLRIIE